MHYLYRYICILNVFYICIWTIVCNKEFIYLYNYIDFIYLCVHMCVYMYSLLNFCGYWTLNK